MTSSPPRKVGDCRWRSADKARGSVRNYARDVKERKKKAKGTRRRAKEQRPGAAADAGPDTVTHKGALLSLLLPLLHS